VSPFGLDRRRHGEDDIWLGQKMLFFVVGAFLGAIGMATDRNWLIYVAIAVLAAGLILRVLGRRTAGQEPEADADRPEDSPPSHS
jgi:protein-S-isoprenylcysteine O-methyltransferase Ste14